MRYQHIENRLDYDRLSKESLMLLDTALSEAHRLCVDYIGTEHLLLGIIAYQECIAHKILVDLHTELNELKDFIEQVVQHGDYDNPGLLPRTNRCKIALNKSMEEADNRDSKIITSEFIFLAILHDNDSVASQICEKFNINYRLVENKINK